MACNNCENNFQNEMSLLLTITKSGSSAQLFVKNQGKNAVEIRRILLCYTTGNSTSTYYLRAAPQSITWLYPLTYLEQGIQWMFYQLNNLPAGAVVQAQAEYIEFDGRSRSCTLTM